MARGHKVTSEHPILPLPLVATDIVEVWRDGKQYHAPFEALGGVPDAHADSHKLNGSDPVGANTPTANAIPVADSNGRLDTWVSDASTSVKGKVRLAGHGESTAGEAMQSDDPRGADARTPTEHAASHVGGTDPIEPATASTDGLMSSDDKALLDSIPVANIPTAEQKAALAGSYGTPSASNKFVTDSDPRIGSTDVDITDISNWASFTKMLDYVKNTGQTSRDWRALVVHDGDLYASVYDGDIYKMDMNGVMQTTGHSSKFCTDLVEYNGSIYGCAYNRDIYIMDSSGILQPTGQTTRGWSGLAVHNGELYASVSVGDIYKMDVYGVMQPTGQTANTWSSIISYNGYLYGTTDFDIGYVHDLWKMDVSGVMQRTNQTILGNRFYSMGIYQNALYVSSQFGDVLYVLNSSDVLVVAGLSSDRAFFALCEYDEDFYGTDAEADDVCIFTSTAPSINIPEVRSQQIPSGFPLGGRKLIRRLAAYDGNAITITPPSGATFEGRASLSLYGQYSFVEIERISATLFAVRDLRDLPVYVKAGAYPSVGSGWLLFNAISSDAYGCIDASSGHTRVIAPKKGVYHVSCKLQLSNGGANAVILSIYKNSSIHVDAIQNDTSSYRTFQIEGDVSLEVGDYIAISITMGKSATVSSDPIFSNLQVTHISEQR